MRVVLIRAKYHSVWEPINLMYLSAFIKEFCTPSPQVEILDAYFDSDEAIVEKGAEADFVGLSGTTPQLAHMIELAKRIKTQSPKARTILGGFGPSLQIHRCLNSAYVDHVVVGEGEPALLAILRGEASGKLVSAEPIDDVDTISFPDREAIDLERYIQIAEREEGRRVTSVVSERGCPFGCTFCAEGEFGTIWRKASEKEGNIQYQRPIRMRLRQPSEIVREMVEVRDRFGITFFKFSDAETNPTKRHFLGICQEMVRQGLNIPWGCNMRADKLNDEMCEWAVKANCQEFWIGVESGSPTIQRHINKGTTIDMIRRAFQVSRQYGIQRRAYCLLGTPPESYETIRETEELLDEIEPDVVGFSILAPYPGTPYWGPDYEDLDWSKVDEYSNTIWSSQYLSNEELRAEQARLMEKYSTKLAPIVRKKATLGIIQPARTLDSYTS